VGVILGLAVGACAAVACEDQRSAMQPHEMDPTPPMCDDADGDGFGLGCADGPDCDDADAQVTVACFCEQITPGCECDDEGAIGDCGRVHSRVGEQMICGQGVTTCTEGKWGECIINSAISLQPPLDLQSLGGPGECEANPCDPDCTTFIDTPTNLPLPVDGGLVSSDAGVTLVGDGGTGGPAIGGGFGCTGGNYPATTNACAHHVCQTGAKLDPTCDQKPAVTSSVTIFSESFSTGSTLAWTLDPTWEIGAATTSTGHTTGSADPAADTTTATTDDRIAGTMVGGNIGGGVTLFSDAFPNLNNWTESGNTDWNTENVRGSSSYPATGSNSPAGHADDCDSACTLSLTNAVNLSGQTSATLELLRYGENLDTGEYLRLEAYNGTTWNVLANWTGTGPNDGDWHEESFNLASYLVSGFKIRFVTQQNATSEHVHVDDVKITVPPANVTRWMTSPAFNGTAANGALSLSFRRWLNVEAAASRTAKFEVWNGSAWVNLYTNVAAVSENAWSTQTFDLTAHKHAAMKIRFGWTGAASSKVSGWNIDDIVLTGTHLTPPVGQCVAKICAKDPTCCSTSWHAGCLAYIEDECSITCSRDTATNKCVACYNDPAETVDYDGDGISRAGGDCLECNPKVSPAAWDIPGNAFDDDCDGTADNEASVCDSALTPGGDAAAHAKAMGLCRTASGDSWGVTSAAFVRANGTTACTDSKQYYITNAFGSGNSPTAGSKMVVYSSGTARDSNDSGWVKPNGSGYNAGTSSTPAYAIPAATGCSSGTSGKDSCGLKVTIKAPSNVQSFSYNFNFFTSEYPEWLCTSYNDAFVAYYLGSLNTQSSKNISFDKQNNPVSVNNGLFDIPAGWPPPASGTHAKLNGTGFDGVCDNDHSGAKYKNDSICGGSTGWLVTSAPVQAGEEITLHFSIWDTGDNQWDSTVLIDNFRWSASTASIETGEYEPGSVGGTAFEPASFTRDYNATGVCDEDQLPTWTIWSWSASTPGDSKIQFFVKTATTQAGLDAAPEDPLVFSNPPGPSAKAGQNAVAQAGSPSTSTGSVYVSEAWRNNARPTHNNFVRVRSYLVPSTDGTAAPALQNWNLQLTCADAE
jgi:hypothetical protein